MTTEILSDEDRALVSKILDRKRKTDLRGLLRAQREGRLDEYIAKDLAKLKRKKKKGSGRVRSVSCAPRSNTKSYPKIERKEDSSSKSKSIPVKAKTRSRAQSTAPKPAVLSSTRQRAISTKPKSGSAVDHKTNAMQKFLTKEKQGKPNIKQKKKKNTTFVSSSRSRSKSCAPETGKLSAMKVFRNMEQKSEPRNTGKGSGSIRRKTSTLDIVHEKPRSNSWDSDTKTNSAMQKFQKMDKQNQPKPKRIKKSSKKSSGGLVTEPVGRVRSKSCYPSTGGKIKRNKKKSILERASMFENEEKQDIPKRKVNKRKTKKIGTKAIKETSDGDLSTGKK